MSTLLAAAARGSSLTFILDEDAGQSTQRWRWGQLLEAAGRRAAALAGSGVRVNEVVLLMDDTCPALVETLLAVLWLGAIPAILAPRRGREHQQFIAGIVRQTCAARMLVGAQVLRRSGDYLKPFAELILPISAQAPDLPSAPQGCGGETAWLQFSSGSTRLQRGVMVSRACLAQNWAALGRRVGVGAGEVFVSWLPLFHDMGLVIGLFGAAAWGGDGVILDSSTFAYRPSTWLRLISEHRGTLSAAPNFAYELCMKRIRDEELEGVNLASWRYSWNGAEMVLPDTVRRFQARFARWGLRQNVLQPGYGAAEATLAVTSHHPGDPFQGRVLSRSGLALGEARAAVHGESGVEVVSVGKPVSGVEIRILDDIGGALPEERVGEIEVRGASVCPGYIGAADPTFGSGCWLSGDMGFMANGELFITGRKKEIMIVDGRNIYPYDVEAAVQEAAPDMVRRAAAFSVSDARHGTERVVVALELNRPGSLDEVTRDKLTAVAASACGTSRVSVVPTQFIPTTTSGKIQRVRLRESYLATANRTGVSP